MGKIYVLTGPVGSGKTTSLERWCQKQKSADGILAPVIEGKRNLKFIRINEIKGLESSAGNNGIKIGRYIFDEKVFEEARNYLEGAFQNNPEWLIIDEIGPLELEGNGLEPAAGKIIKQIKSTHTNIILVIREGLLDKVFKHYNLSPEEIFNFNPLVS